MRERAAAADRTRKGVRARGNGFDKSVIGNIVAESFPALEIDGQCRVIGDKERVRSGDGCPWRDPVADLQRPASNYRGSGVGLDAGQGQEARSRLGKPIDASDDATDEQASRIVHGNDLGQVSQHKIAADGGQASAAIDVDSRCKPCCGNRERV